MPRPIGVIGYTFCLCVAIALLGTLENGLVKLNLVTLERRFRLATSQLALALAAYDVAFIVALLPFTHLAGGPHSDKPRLIAIGLLIIGLGSITLSLPEFLYPQTTPHSANDSDLCLADSSFKLSPSEPQNLSHFEIVCVLIVGQTLIGIGAMPLYTFAVTWIDENIPKKSSAMYVGFFFTSSILGPALGFVVGGYVLDHVHSEFLTHASPLVVDSWDSRWIGAWWVLFLGIGLACFVHGMFMLLYPKNLVRSGPDELYNMREGGGERSSVLKVLKDLSQNSIFVSLCLVCISEGYILSSFSSFLSKYVQNQFGLSTKGSSIIMGCLIVPAGFLGIITGGYFIKRHQLSTFRLLLLIVVCLILSLLFCAGFILVNEPVKFAGINTPYNSDKSYLNQRHNDLFRSSNQLDVPYRKDRNNIGTPHINDRNSIGPRSHDPFYRYDRNGFNQNSDPSNHVKSQYQPDKHSYQADINSPYQKEEFSYQQNKHNQPDTLFHLSYRNSFNQMEESYHQHGKDSPSQPDPNSKKSEHNSPNQFDAPFRQHFKNKPEQLSSASNAADGKMPRYALLSECNKYCDCNAAQYNPVCGVDLVTYYNPCFAGCRSQAVDRYGIKIYYDCSCISHTLNHSNKDFIEGDRGSFKMYRQLFVTSFLKNLEEKEKAKTNSADKRIGNTFVEQAIEKKIDEMIEDIVGENQIEEHLVNVEDVQFERDRRKARSINEEMKNSNLENTPTMELSKPTTPSQVTPESLPSQPPLQSKDNSETQNTKPFQHPQTDLFSSVFSLAATLPTSSTKCKTFSVYPTDKVTFTSKKVNEASSKIPAFRDMETHFQTTTSLLHPLASSVGSSRIQPSMEFFPKMDVPPPVPSDASIIHSQSTTSVAEHPSLPREPTHENLVSFPIAQSNFPPAQNSRVLHSQTEPAESQHLSAISYQSSNTHSQQTTPVSGNLSPTQPAYSPLSPSCTESSASHHSPIRGRTSPLRKTSAFGKACPNTSTHVVLFSLSTFFAFYFMFLCIMPATEGILRSVPFQDKSLALALQWLLIRALATMPSPSILALFIDSSCLYWRSGEYCILYDNYYFSRYLASYAFFFRHMSIYIVLYMMFKVKIDELK